MKLGQSGSSFDIGIIYGSCCDVADAVIEINNIDENENPDKYLEE